MKTVDAILALLVVGGIVILCVTFVGRQLVRRVRLRRAKWEPMDPLHGKNTVMYQIGCFGQMPHTVAAIPYNAEDYDEQVAQAESDSITQCSRRNSSTKLIRKFQ